MSNHYDIPKWAGKPPVGLHLDVSKDDKLIQKLMIDEKKCYLFGRNPQLNDFCIDHASCSRVHSTLVYHKHLNLPFLVDLGSTHGTYIGQMRLEADKPTQLPINSAFHFGASTRIYTIRERPQTAPKPVMEELERMTEDSDGGLLGLPETETELDNLTEFNTAHNRRISMLGIGEDEPNPRSRKRHKYNISFKDEEDIINPEDIDPTVGKFRNLIQTTVLPVKKRRLDVASLSLHNSGRAEIISHHGISVTHFPKSDAGLYSDIPPEQHTHSVPVSHTIFSSLLSAKLGLPLPNPAPDVELTPSEPIPQPEIILAHIQVPFDPDEPKKKKYAKESWPGKKSLPSLLV